MENRITSQLDESINYDDELVDNSLSDSDKGTESDVYQINIFGIVKIVIF